MILGDAGGPRPRRAFQVIEELGYQVDIFADNVPECLHPVRFINRGVLNRSEISLREGSRFLLGKLWRFRGYAPGFLCDRINDIGFNLDRFDEFIKSNYKLIIVEDLALLPLVFRHPGSGIVIFDAREYYPKEFEGSRLFDLYEKPARESLCRRYLSKCDAVMTVSPGLVSQYNIDYNISPILFRSLPYYHCLSTKKTENNNS